MEGRRGALGFLFPRGWPLACGWEDREKVPFFASFFGQAKNEEACGRNKIGIINQLRKERFSKITLSLHFQKYRFEFYSNPTFGMTHGEKKDGYDTHPSFIYIRIVFD